MIKKKQASSPPSKYIVKQSAFSRNAPQEVLVSDTSIRAHQYFEEEPNEAANKQTAKFYSPQYRAELNANPVNPKSPLSSRQAQPPYISNKDFDRAKSPKLSNAQQQALLQLEKAKRNKANSITQQTWQAEEYRKEQPLRTEIPKDQRPIIEDDAMNVRPLDQARQGQKQQRQRRVGLGAVGEQKEYVFPNGDRYNGAWNGKWVEGSGVYDFAKQNLQYRGEFKRSKQHGKGTLLRRPTSAGLREDVVYEGEWMNGYKQGHGKYVYFKDTYYEGQWQNNCKEGLGTFKSPDGEYVGQWINNKKQGKGKLTIYSGILFEGVWENDQFVDGIVVYSNGDRYEGEFKGELREGFGVYSYANNKTQYRGRWQNGNKHGSGTINYYNGDKYDGAMVQNRKQGNIGSYQWASGDRVRGEFANDLPIRGKIQIKDEEQFEYDLSK